MIKSSILARTALTLGTAAAVLVPLAGTAQAAGVDEIYRGSRGTGVKCVQMAVNAARNTQAGIAEDGIWGPATEAAVRKFQERNYYDYPDGSGYERLVADGIVGRKTGTAMLEVIVHERHDWGTKCWENLPTW